MTSASEHSGGDTTILPLAHTEVLRIWLQHLTSFVVPSITLFFLWTGPHHWYVAPLFMLPVGVLLYIDQQGAAELRQPRAELPAWPFDLIVYGLAALQFIILFELAEMFAVQDIFSIDMAMVVAVVGGSSGFSIITAHELIHRNRRWERDLGRLLLCTVLYEHFFTEHLRGHHRLVGTDDDPATARFGESFPEFWRRTVPAQFRSAWTIEARRLGDAEMRLFDARMIRNRVIHGLIVGWGLAISVYWFFGVAALIAFLLQAFLAVRLLEVVNYFEHWGLQRKNARVRPQDSWDTHSRFTYYGLTGLSRHADHHAFAARPFQDLRVWDDAPMLPTGYFGLIDMIMTNNKTFIESAIKELQRRQLGPYAVDATPVELARLADFEEREAAELGVESGWGPGWSKELLQSIPAWSRPILFWSTAVVVLTIGARIETGTTAGGSFFFSLLRNFAILAVFVGAFLTQQVVARRTGREGAAWFIAFAALFAVGSFINGVIY